MASILTVAQQHNFKSPINLDFNDMKFFVNASQMVNPLPTNLLKVLDNTFYVDPDDLFGDSVRTYGIVYKMVDDAGDHSFIDGDVEVAPNSLTMTLITDNPHIEASWEPSADIDGAPSWNSGVKCKVYDGDTLLATSNHISTPYKDNDFLGGGVFIPMPITATKGTNITIRFYISSTAVIGSCRPGQGLAQSVSIAKELNGNIAEQ